MTLARRFAQANRNKKCSVPDCHNLRTFTSKLCKRHRRRNERYGDPTSRAIRAADLRGCHLTVSSFFETQKGHPGVIAARQILDEYVAGSHGQYVNRELARLREKKVDGKTLLNRVAAVWVYGAHRAYALETDRAMTFALGRAVTLAAPQTKYYSPKWGVRYRRPTATALLDIGTFIRRNIGLFLSLLVETLNKRGHIHEARAEKLFTPFF